MEDYEINSYRCSLYYKENVLSCLFFWLTERALLQHEVLRITNSDTNITPFFYYNPWRPKALGFSFIHYT